MNAVSTAVSAGSVDPSCLDKVALSVLETLRRLPKTYGKRFAFDALLIRAMTADWGPQNLFSNMLVPNYDEGWGNASLTPTGFVQISGGMHLAHVVDLILFPGRDDLTEVNLLAYPWLAHELAHNLMFRHDQYFVPAMEQALDVRLKALRIASIADRGTARSKAYNFIDEVSSFWAPTRDHKNWAHEIAADIIALFILGPAYLGVFEDLAESDHPVNPYHV